MQELDSGVMRCYRSLHPVPPKSHVPELFEEYTRCIKEGEVLLYDNQQRGISEGIKLFLFNTCFLLCRQSSKNGKWDLRVLIRLNKAVRYESLGGMRFSVTAKGRSFEFGCMDKREAQDWVEKLKEAINDKREAPKKQVDPQVGGLLEGLKAGLSFGEDDYEDENDEQNSNYAPDSNNGFSSSSSNKNVVDDDDDDDFAAIANRSSKAPVVNSNVNTQSSGGLDDFFASTPSNTSSNPPINTNNNTNNNTNQSIDFFGGPAVNTTSTNVAPVNNNAGLDFFGGPSLQPNNVNTAPVANVNPSPATTGGGGGGGLNLMALYAQTPVQPVAPAPVLQPNVAPNYAALSSTGWGAAPSNAAPSNAMPSNAMPGLMPNNNVMQPMQPTTGFAAPAPSTTTTTNTTSAANNDPFASLL